MAGPLESELSGSEWLDLWTVGLGAVWHLGVGTVGLRVVGWASRVWTLEVDVIGPLESGLPGSVRSGLWKLDCRARYGRVSEVRSVGLGVVALIIEH